MKAHKKIKRFGDLVVFYGNFVWIGIFQFKEFIETCTIVHGE